MSSAEAKQGNGTTALSLLREGADPNAFDRHRFSALSRAVQYECVEFVRALIAAGAEVSHIGVTPLMNAKSPEVADALLAAGAEINAVKVSDRFGLGIGRSTLISASQGGRLSVVETLLVHGANRDIQDREGATALMLAAMNGDDAVVRVLIEGGASIDWAVPISGPRHRCCSSRSKWLSREFRRSLIETRDPPEKIT